MKQKYHPIDAARLRHLVAGLLPSYGKVDLDVHYTIRGLLVTLAEPNKLHGYVGTIRGDHAHVISRLPFDAACFLPKTPDTLTTEERLLLGYMVWMSAFPSFEDAASWLSLPRDRQSVKLLFPTSSR